MIYRVVLWGLILQPIKHKQIIFVKLKALLEGGIQNLLMELQILLHLVTLQYETMNNYVRISRQHQ